MELVLLPTCQFSSSSSPDTPRTQVVLPSHQFSSSSCPDTPHTTVVLPSRQFSSSSSPETPPTTVVLQRRSSHLPAPQLLRDCAYYSCTTTTSPALVFQLPRYSAYKVVLRRRQLPRYSTTPPTKVVLRRPQFSSSSSPGGAHTKVLL